MYEAELPRLGRELVIKEATALCPGILRCKSSHLSHFPQKGRLPTVQPTIPTILRANAPRALALCCACMCWVDSYAHEKEKWPTHAPGSIHVRIHVPIA